jgi:hypothetical protein
MALASRVLEGRVLDRVVEVGALVVADEVRADVLVAGEYGGLRLVREAVEKRLGDVLLSSCTKRGTSNGCAGSFRGRTASAVREGIEGLPISHQRCCRFSRVARIGSGALRARRRYPRSFISTQGPSPRRNRSSCRRERSSQRGARGSPATPPPLPSPYFRKATVAEQVSST